ncbi:MAG: VWA domain-containing protein [Nitrospinae bacterium]|nr:VWA domain-containing protein [Nitrospinota bacterium]
MIFFRFHDPWLLLLLAGVPALMMMDRENRRAALHYSSIQNLQAVRSRTMSLVSVIPPALRYLTIALLVVALARPQEGRKTVEILSAGVDIVLAIDASGSMQALDFFKDKNRVNRLEAVKDVARDFVNNRPNDRIGMVVFGAEAFTQCPLTLDHNVLLSFLDRVKIGVAGDATAIGSAIGISVKRLKDLKSKSKVVILLTDGRSNAGNIPPLQAAEIAKQYGVKIYTIGVGTHGKAPFLADAFFGGQLVYQDVDLDEDTLKSIANLTGAQYFRAADRESLTDVYNQIDRLEKSEVKVVDHSEYTEMFPVFLVPGLLLALLDVLVSNTRLQRIP